MPLSEWDQYRHDQAQSWLENVAQHKARMREAESAVDELRELATGVGGIDYRREHVDASANPDRMPNAVDRIIAAAAAWSAEVGGYVDEVTAAKIAVNALRNPKHRLVLQRIYFDGWDVSELSNDQGLRYSKAHLARLHQQALIMLYENIPAPYRGPMPPAI